MISFTDKRKDWDRLGKLLKGEGAGVKVGYPDGGGAVEGGLSAAELAAVHEFGTSTEPQQSFVRAGLDAKQDVLMGSLARAAGAALDGKATLEEGLVAVGKAGVDAIREFVASGKVTPGLSSEKTGAKRSGVALERTGQLIGALSAKPFKGTP